MDMRKVVRIDHETDGKAYRHAAEHRGQARKRIRFNSELLHSVSLPRSNRRQCVNVVVTHPNVQCRRTVCR